MKERIIRTIKHPRGATKTGVLVVTIIISLVVGYMVRGVFVGTDSGKAGASAQQAASKKDKAPQLWSCSMHPQIKLLKPDLCPLCNMKLIPLETQDEDAGSLRELTVSENARKLMEIQTTPVERKFVEAEVRMVGKIDYDETRLKYITAWIPGRLDRLFIDYTGVSVKKGDDMVSLYSPELLSAQEELLQALETVKDLKKSDIGIIRKTSEATVVAVREKLRLWGLKPEQIAEIEKRGTTSDHMKIYAPIGGIVIHKNAQEGMYVNTGTKIYTIADLLEVWVRLDAYESDLMWLRYGQKVEFTTEAIPGERFVGTIAFIDPILTQTTRTVKVRINATNFRMRLKPGMFVRAVARAKVAAGVKVMDAALAGKWICRKHPEIVKENAGKCDICEMPLMRTESLDYLGPDITKADKPLVIPAAAALVTGTRAIVYVETDPSLLRSGSVADWTGLLTMIRASVGAATSGPSPFIRLWTLLSAGLREELLAVKLNEIPTAEVQHRFMNEINGILKSDTLYDPPLWKDIKPGAEVAAALQQGIGNLSLRKLTRFNRLLLQAIFPKAIVKSKSILAFEGREIVLGPRAGDYYLVRHGLKEGQRVVTKGNFKLDAELQIQSKPSMMTPEVGGGAGKKDTGSGKIAMRLPPTVQVQLHAVLAVGQEIDSAIVRGDLDAIRSAFADLQRKVEGVNGQKLLGHMKMLWQEYSMLLTNDAIEGKEATNLKTAERVAGMMNEHLASMKSKLGLELGRSLPTTSVINPKFRQQLAKAAAAYLAIQQTLAKDDSRQASDAAKKMADAITSVDMKLLQGEDHMAWMKTSGELKKILAGVIQAEGLEPVRKEFALLSEEMAAAAKRFGIVGRSLYQFKCPMAFNNRGATWLQADGRTRNPYFGTAMLQCGEVIHVLSGVKKKGGSDE